MDLNTQPSKNKNKSSIGIISVILIVVIFTVCSFGVGYNIGTLKKQSKLEQENTLLKEKLNEETKAIEKQKEILEENKENLKKLGDEFVSISKTKHPECEWSILIKDLDTQNEYVYNNKKMNSASLIKLFMMEAVLKTVQNETFHLTDEYKLNLEKMITESNNDSANLFIDAYDGYNAEKRKVTENHTINKIINDSGYKYTELNRKMHNSTPPGGPTGYQNYTSVQDVSKLLEGIYKGTILNEENTKLYLSFLKNQQRKNKIPNKINKEYPDIVVANKTGELSNVENDAALIFGDDFNVIFVVMTENKSSDMSEKEKIQNTISDLALKLVEFYQK